MKSTVRHPATALSLLALFVAIGGTGYAASKIGTGDIEPKAVTGSKIAKEAIKNSKIVNDTISGNKINESTLGEVPSAANAVNALNAQNSANVAYTRPFLVKLGLGETQVIETNGVVSLVGSCVEQPAAGDTTARIVATTTEQGGTVLTGNDSYDGSAANGFLAPTTPADQSVMMSQTSAGQPGQTDVDGVIDSGFVFGSDGKGLSVDAETTMLAVNYLGSRCALAGMVSKLGG